MTKKTAAAKAKWLEKGMECDARHRNCTDFDNARNKLSDALADCRATNAVAALTHNDATRPLGDCRAERRATRRDRQTRGSCLHERDQLGGRPGPVAAPAIRAALGESATSGRPGLPYRLARARRLRWPSSTPTRWSAWPTSGVAGRGERGAHLPGQRCRPARWDRTLSHRNRRQGAPGLTERPPNRPPTRLAMTTAVGPK